MQKAEVEIRGDVRLCLNNTRELLQRTLVREEGGVGWRQFLRASDRVGTYGTACGLIAYSSVAPDDHATLHAVASHLASMQRPDGSWESPTIARGIGLTAATAYSAVALLRVDSAAHEQRIKAAVEWLAGLVGPDGSVGPAPGAPPSVASAALTLRLLCAREHHGYAAVAGSVITWLRNAQNADGGFGEGVRRASTLHHTSEAIIALSAARPARAELGAVLRSAGEYVNREWRLGENRFRDIAYISVDGREVMLPHSFQTDGLLLQAIRRLATSGLLRDREAQIIPWLLSQQTDGSWRNDTLPNKIPVWAIMECTVGLSEYLETGGERDPVVTVPSTGRKPIDILCIATEWSSGKGGLSTFNRELCVALAAKGCRVVCYLPSASQTEEEDAQRAGVILCKPTVPEAQKASQDLLYRRPQLPPDFATAIVIGHGRITGAVAAAQVHDNFRSARRVHFVHMIPEEIEWLKGKPDAAETAESRTREEMGLCQEATLVAGVGPRITREVQTSLHGVQIQGTILQINPGMRTASRPNASPPAGVRCLVLGRTEDMKLKGLDIAARAMAALPISSLQSNVPKLVVRGAPDGTGASLQAQLLKIAGRAIEVIVREYVPDSSRIVDDLMQASVLLMPSRKEGFGLVAAEAVAAGVPVLVSDQSGFGELVVEILGEVEARNYVVPTSGRKEEDEKAWATAIEFVLRDRTAAFERAAKLRAALSGRLSWEAAADAVLKVADND